jgi:hypothetical protein
VGSLPDRSSPGAALLTCATACSTKRGIEKALHPSSLAIVRVKQDQRIDLEALASDSHTRTSLFDVSHWRNVKGPDEAPFHIFRFDSYSDFRNRQFEPLGFVPWVVFAFDARLISRSNFSPVKKTSLSDWLPSPPVVSA